MEEGVMKRVMVMFCCSVRVEVVLEVVVEGVRSEG